MRGDWEEMASEIEGKLWNLIDENKHRLVYIYNNPVTNGRNNPEKCIRGYLGSEQRADI